MNFELHEGQLSSVAHTRLGAHLWRLITNSQAAVALNASSIQRPSQWLQDSKV